MPGGTHVFLWELPSEDHVGSWLTDHNLEVAHGDEVFVDGAVVLTTIDQNATDFLAERLSPYKRQPGLVTGDVAEVHGITLQAPATHVR